MNHIEQAIKEAVEKGGYTTMKSNDVRIVERLLPRFTKASASSLAFRALANAALLDPAFWQALGKARGWFTLPGQCGGYVGRVSFEGECDAQKKCAFCNWHRFINHLAEGKDAESFFAKLLS